MLHLQKISPFKFCVKTHIAFINELLKRSREYLCAKCVCASFIALHCFFLLVCDCCFSVSSTAWTTVLRSDKQALCEVQVFFFAYFFWSSTFAWDSLQITKKIWSTERKEYKRKAYIITSNTCNFLMKYIYNIFFPRGGVSSPFCTLFIFFTRRSGQLAFILFVRVKPMWHLTRSSFISHIP